MKDSNKYTDIVEALVKSRKLGGSQKLSKKDSQSYDLIELVEIGGPGFINIKLSQKYLGSVAEMILKVGDDFGKNDAYKGYKAIFEYTDPNPLKIFHIGHFMSNAIGETNARISEFHNCEVKRACYFGDTGVHIAKTMYVLKDKDIDRDAPLVELVKVLGESYAEGNNLYEDDPKAKEEIDALNKSIYLQEDTEVFELYKWARQVSLDYFETIYKKLDTKFDFYFPESIAAPVGKKLVEDNIGKVFEESDGAVVFHAEKHDESLHTRVFINKFGVPTYEAKELALAKN